MAEAGPEAAPTWDQIVDRVCVASNYLCLERAAGHWQTVFGESGQLSQLRGALQKLLIQSGTQWHGAGAAAFQQHIGKLIGAVEGIQNQYRGLPRAAADSATHLRTAVENIHVPLNRYDEVVQAQEAFHAGVPWYIRPFSLDLALYRAWPETYNAFQRWLGYGETAAQEAYNQLVSDYGADRKLIPSGDGVPVPGVGSASTQDGRTVPGAGPAAGPGTKGPDGAGTGLSPGGLQAPASTAGLNTPTAPDTTLPDLSTTKPPDLPGIPSGTAELPGLGGPDTSGLAGIGGVGGGVGGVGGGAGVGPPGAAPGSTAAGFGAPGSAARGLGAAGAGGASAAGSGMGMYPPMMPMGGHGAGRADSTDGFLREDEVRVMFGFDSDDTPGDGVLGA